MLRRRVFHFAVVLMLAVTAQAHSWSSTYGQCYIFCNSGMVAISTSLEECCGNCTTYLQCPDGSGGGFGHSWFPDWGSGGEVTLCQAC